MSVRLAHIADTHLGYEAYSSLSTAGNNQRGEDVVRAFRTAVRDIVAADPPLVVHAGDVADRPQTPTQYMLEARKGLAALAGIRPDGTRRQVVVVAGNHDAPRHRRDACWLELFRGLPGLHIVTVGAATIRFDAARDGCDKSLEGCAITAVPHDSLKLLAELELAPVPEVLNVLVTHGVSEGSVLYQRVAGREYPIPADLLAAGWDYVALGHWHRQGPVPLLGSLAASPAWYCGSTETIGFRDLRGTTAIRERTWLDVTVERGSAPAVTAKSIPVRPVMRLPEIDVAGLEHAKACDALAANLAGVETSGAVIAQPVSGAARDTWALVDTTPARRAAGAALHYELSVRYGGATAGEREASEAATLEALLAERAMELVAEPLRDDALALARKLLGKELHNPTGEVGMPAGVEDTDASAGPEEPVAQDGAC